MDQPSLSGCYIKLGRANVHRKSLEREIRPILEFVKEAVLTETTYDPDSEQFLLKVRYAPAVRPELSPIAGDVIHNLRSALDYLVYQAVWKITGTRWDEGQFPMASSPARFSARDNVLFRKLGSTYGAIVKRHQPFDEVSDLRTAGIAGNDLAVIEARTDNGTSAGFGSCLTGTNIGCSCPATSAPRTFLSRSETQSAAIPRRSST